MPVSTSVVVVVERDPDGGTDVSVFDAGVEVAARVVCVDPGRGWTRAEWDEARVAARLGACSESEAEVIGVAFDRYADSEYIEDVPGAVQIAQDGTFTVGEAVRIVQDRSLVSGHVYADLGGDRVGVSLHGSGGVGSTTRQVVRWVRRAAVLRSGVACACVGGDAQPVFYSLPAHHIEVGVSTADGQDVVAVHRWALETWVQVYTPRHDDPTLDVAHRASPEWRVCAPGERVDLAVFADTGVDLSDHPDARPR